MTNILRDDLTCILKNTQDIFQEFNYKKIFLTGGTGFFGKWLLEAFSFAIREMSLNIHVSILSRNPEGFRMSYPHLYQNSYFTFIKGDISNFTLPGIDVDYIIHAATEASARLNHEQPLVMLDSVVNGTRHVLEFAGQQRVKKMLYISSGAVYGVQPDDLKGFSEEYMGGPDPLKISSAYSEAKRLTEVMCACYSRQYQIDIPVARCFSFVGPYLELDAHFAIGNFIRNGLDGENIIIKGDGKPLRSYMYAADLVIWLLHILMLGKSSEAYNVGSYEAVSIKELAYKVASFFPGQKVEVLNQVHPTDRNQNYIPDIQKTMKNFNLPELVPLDDSISRTIRFHKQAG